MLANRARSIVVRLILLVQVFAVLVSSDACRAQDLPATQLLPPSCVVYAEATQPSQVMSAILDHPLCAEIQSLDVWKNVTQSQPYRNFLTGRKFFEIQMGMEWRQAVESLTMGGIYAAFDARSQGAVLLVRAKDESTVTRFKDGILELIRAGKGPGEATDEYRGVSIYKIEKGGVAAVGEWLVVVNKGEPGKFVLDRLLDHRAGIVSDGATLAENVRLSDALSQGPVDSSVVAFLDLEVIRSDSGVQKALNGQAENPLVEMLAGGIQSTLQKSPWVSAHLSISGPKESGDGKTGDGLSLSFSAPFSDEWIPEERHHFFGTEPEGHAPLLPEIPEQVLSIGTWRDVSDMWLRAGDLFDENMNDQIANAESTLTTLFAGRDFAEEILGSFQPQMGLVVVRQQFGDARPQPAIKLPSFALVLEMREPERMTRELRRTFQSMIGFFNVVGAMEGRPQLEMDMRKLESGELVVSEYIPEDDDRDSMFAPIIFNFSPSVGFVGSRFVLSSTQQLAQKLVTAPVPSAPAVARPNTSIAMSAPILRQILADNRDHLISQNMLEEGRTREEAEVHIDLLLKVLGYFQGAGLELVRDNDTLKLKLNLSVRSQQ
ncbi:MAG: hypothetical protein R3C20_00275 [Planctomycetaceae bacterium]